MKEKLRNFIFAELIYHEDPASFGDDDDLLEAGLDSMGIMRLIMFAEKAFGVTLPDTPPFTFSNGLKIPWTAMPLNSTYRRRAGGLFVA